MDLIKGVNTSQVLSYINTIEMDTSVSPDFIVTIFWSLLALGLTAGGYWLFIVPWNFAKDFTEVSFNFALSKKDSRNPTKKRDVINKLRRTRHMGDALPCPFPNGWYAILESCKLAKGKSTNVSCLGEQFVVYRTEKNEVYVLDAYCPHMGANLGVGGKVVGDSIVCPFHEWSFRGSDGKCNNIPYSTCAIPQSAKVRKWESQDVNGYIFIWYHAENEEPWKLPIVKEIEVGKLVYHGRNEYFVNSHIQDMPENGADLAHFTAIHNASFAAGGDPQNNFLRSLGKHHWEATWKANEAVEEKHIATVSIFHALEVFHKMRIGTMDVKAIQIGPAYVQLHLYTMFGLVVILQTCCPVEPLMQKVIHRFYGPPGSGPFMKFVIYAESIMFERDVNVWNHKKFAHNPCLAKEDRCIKLFRQWFSQFYSENSKTYQQAKESLEW